MNCSEVRDRWRSDEAGGDDEAAGGHQGEGEGQDDGGASWTGRETAAQVARTTNPGEPLFGQLIFLIKSLVKFLFVTYP